MQTGLICLDEYKEFIRDAAFSQVLVGTQEFIRNKKEFKCSEKEATHFFTKLYCYLGEKEYLKFKEKYLEELPF